jgi:hypothetical protein
LIKFKLVVNRVEIGARGVGLPQPQACRLGQVALNIRRPA